MKRILVFAVALTWAATALAQAATRDVARQAVLYEEGAGQGDKAEGQVTWRTERTADPSAPPGDIIIRGDVVIPSRGVRMTVSFRRNFDSSLSASHTVQVDFTPPLDFAGGRIKQVMGLMLKTSEQAKGVPIDALSVKIDDTHFLIGMSGVAQNASANRRLIRSRDWIDIPLFYGTERRAILAIAKDGDAAAMFNTVFAD
ncbi:hypothetical protein [Bradyrhizobium japonicum]|uniref:hypothetical protein n=1 Tax=Bradyrhizobium japonicum TaxID=375 RepID=UPI0012BBE4BD|nr:hypothetical protein [Bradyrhizobium japonicum]